MLEIEENTIEVVEMERHPVVDTALEILTYRFSTIPERPEYDLYRASTLANIAILEQGNPTTLAKKMLGHLSEGLFLIACRENLPAEIRISNAQEDMQGVDFFLGSAKKRIDVTTNPGKYSSKMFNRDKTTIILPPSRELIRNILLQDGEFDTQRYLLDIFELNMEILNNRYPQFQILLATRAKKRSNFNEVVSRGYKRKNQHINPSGHRDKVYMKKAQYQQMIDILSIIKNFPT